MSVASVVLFTAVFSLTIATGSLISVRLNAMLSDLGRKPGPAQRKHDRF